MTTGVFFTPKTKYKGDYRIKIYYPISFNIVEVGYTGIDVYANTHLIQYQSRSLLNLL